MFLWDTETVHVAHVHMHFHTRQAVPRNRIFKIRKNLECLPNSEIFMLMT